MRPSSPPSRLIAAVLCCTCATAAWADIRGAGASFPAKVYIRWGEAYARDHGTRFSYAATGSGDGLRRIAAREVDFGASDSPLSEKALSQQKLVQIPTMVGGVVPVVNLPGIGPNRLQLSGPVLAAVMAGEITAWNDPRIAALNRGLPLPSLPVRRIVREEASGSSETLVRYLGGVVPAFAAKVPPSLQPAWPGEVVRAAGNDGVLQALHATPGAITYSAYDRVLADKLSAVRLQNRAGAFVEASPVSFRAAVAASRLSTASEPQASLLDAEGPQSWPIAQATYVLLDAAPRDAASVRDTLRFFYSSFVKGDRLLEGTGFAPLPTQVQARVLTRFRQIRPRDGSDVLGLLR